MNPPKLSFGLNKAALPRVAPKPSKLDPKGKGKGKANALAFGQDDDDEDEQSNLAPPRTTRTGPGGVSTARLSKAQREKQARELELDQSAYEYDEVYDQMKLGEKQAQAVLKAESSDRKPKYISKLMETAELRKQDRLRAEDKMIAKEREREGDEFQDKEQFVTPAYLRQQEELRQIELEEKRLEELNAGKQGGMTSFYKSYLDSTSATHAAAVAATLAKPSSSPASFTVQAPPAPEREKTEVEIAREFEEKTGKKLEVNDDGEIVDKRQLMAGGLNIVSKPKKLGPQLPGASSGGGFSVPISERTKAASTTDGRGLGTDSQSLLHPGVSAEERKRQMRERQSREIERQMVELDKKRKREQEEARELNVAKKKERRNDESKVEMLKRMAEERRKKREEERANEAAQ
ncbi:nuclear speckle splicing regulatory family 1 protein [Sporobolomyces koalae]|uniref:nuclear speckle splicing regulatory family 1 protein n=1 Tax=Sporobolomyces koalae TaxID=500713 RepID=UPI0031700A27